MKIYVYEQDPLIREDIVETLSGAFEGRVRSTSSLGDTLFAAEGEGSVVVLSLSRSEIAEHLDVILDTMAPHNVVLIAGSICSEIVAQVGAYVPKPFGSDAVIDAVKSVLCVPQ